MTPPAGPPPAKGGGCWKWGAIGCGLAALLAAIFAIAVVTIVFGAIKSTDAYKEARSRAANDPRVIAAIGSPIEAGFFVSGNVNVQSNRGDADISFSVSGPKGKAAVHAVATRDATGWHYSELTAKPQNAAVIDLLR